MNDSYKQASSDARTRDIDNQISLANAKYTTAFNTQNQILTNNLTAYQKQQDQIVAKRSLVMNEYQKNLALQTAQAQFDQELAQKAQLAQDPQTAIQTVMDEYKKLGIPFTSTIQSRLAEFQASGLSLPDFLTKMSKNIQESP